MERRGGAFLYENLAEDEEEGRGQGEGDVGHVTYWKHNGNVTSLGPFEKDLTIN